MNIGSLYQVKERFWVLFPTKEIVARTDAKADAPIYHGGCGTNNDKNADWYAANYSRAYNCNVNWFSPESFVVFLEEDRKLKKFLTSEGLIGWTQVNKAWLGCFEEVKSE
jgi:hypothetical protein